jgi:hypothetical protein
MNKLFLIAKGTLLTVITDDDIFHFKTLTVIKNFMLQHPEIDLTGSEGGFKDQNLAKEVRPLHYEQNYRKWQNKHTPFSSCGLGLVYRRSSLPLLGLWNPSFKQLDAEFTLRNTAGKANIAWCTGHTYVNVSGPQSTSILHMKKIKKEGEILKKLYLGKNPDNFIIQKLKIILNKIKNGNLLINKQLYKKEPIKWEDLAGIAGVWLEQINHEKKLKFLWNEKHDDR